MAEGQSYRFTVKAKDVAGNLSAASDEAIVGGGSSDGLVYSYYEGSWSKLPNFDNLTAVKSGVVENFTLSPRNRNDNFAFLYQGTINVPANGEYTFYTESDDGSKLYINGTQIVNNDGLHGKRERSGKITLNAGPHAIVASFFERGGGQHMEVRWKGPGISKQEIPNSALAGSSPTASAPISPTGLSSSSVMHDGASLRWTDNSNDELSFQLYRSGSASGPFSSVAVLGANTTSYQAVGLEAQTTYHYKVRARSAAGNSTFSNTVSVTTPAAPDVMPVKLYTTRLNFTKNATAPSPWYNTSKEPAVGDVFSDLPDAQGTGTGISVKLLSAFGGSYNQGASTGDNSGIVPDAALAEYYWFGIFGAPNTVQVEVSGLDPGKLYDLSFVASSVFNQSGVTDNGSTVFSIGDRSATVYAQANTDQAAVIAGYAPDGSGKAVVTLSKAAGSRAGYLNALVIEAYSNPSAPEQGIAQVDAYGVSKSAIQVDWTGVAGATRYKLYRSSTAAGGFSEVYSGSATGYTDSGLSAGSTYYYRVEVQYGDGSSSASLPVPGASLSQLSYLNMNGEQRYDAPYPWNNFGVLPSSGDVFGNFRDESGSATGMVIEFRESLTGANDWGLSTGNNSGVYPDKAMKSFFFMETFEEAELVVRGLDETMRYNFVFFNSIDQNFSVTTDFSIGDQTVVAEARDNTRNTERIRGVVPDANGEVVIRISSAENWSIFNALVVEAYPGEGGLNARSAGVSSGEVEAYDKSVYQGLSGSDLSEVVVYPNPFGEVLRVEVGGSLAGSYRYEVSDLLGVWCTAVS